MTNGGGAGMAFMTKKKKYKFQVEVCLEELLEVPFVSAVLFAKLRLLDGGFQDHSSREEVAEHSVKWGSRFSFPCKMLANASTGVLEPCILRISIRKECKGGRSFTKLGFVDLNLAEFAGAGETSRKALLEGYDNRRRQDNSMLRFSIKMNMLSGDILFKVPSPSLKHKPVVTEDQTVEPRPLDDYSTSSLAGSIASASSGFGSLPKKRPPLLSSELILGQSQNENIPITIASDINEPPIVAVETEEVVCEPGHSRNSSNTSQMSKASGYSSIHSHSRQSSSGDSGHIRDLHKPKWFLSPLPSKPFAQNSRNYSVSHNKEIYGTPQGTVMLQPNNSSEANVNSSKVYYTPKSYQSQNSNISSSSTEEYKTPECTLMDGDVFALNLNHAYPPETKKSCSCNAVEQRVKNMSTINEMPDYRLSDNSNLHRRLPTQITIERCSFDETNLTAKPIQGVLRSKSDFEIPRKSPTLKPESIFQNFSHKSDVLLSFLTPRARRKAQNSNSIALGNQSTPKQGSPKNNHFKIPGSPIPKYPQRSLPGTRTTSPTLVKSRLGVPDEQQPNSYQIQRSLPHRKLLEGSSGGKLAPVAISPDETPATVSFDCSQNPSVRRPSVTTNPSSSSLVLSETGSLDRAKAALERRKKAQAQESDLNTVSGRVEVTRVNPDHLIAELLKNTNLEPTDDSAENVQNRKQDSIQSKRGALTVGCPLRRSKLMLENERARTHLLTQVTRTFSQSVPSL